MAADSFVVELASNDGYLLQYFVERGIPCLGIEPAANVAAAAVERGVPTDVSFFGVERAKRLADDGRLADLVLGNNVLAQVPDLNDFVAGIPTILAPDGTVTIEFPHVLRLLEENQFDTIYHEHYCYFSLISAEAIFAGHGMTIFDVDELWTHGGSLRIYARHAADTQPLGERACHRAARARGGSRVPRRRNLRAVRGAGPGDQAGAARPAVGHQARGRQHRRVWRTREGQHAAQLLRHPH